MLTLMDETKIKRGSGRPPKPAEEGKRQSLTFRLSADMRTEIERAAMQKGRSLAQEVESRLERTFEIEKVLGSQEHARFLRLLAASSDSFGRFFQQIAALKTAIEARTNALIECDPATFWAMRAGTLELLDRMMPEESAWVAAQHFTSSDQASENYVDERPTWEDVGIQVARAIYPTPLRHPGLVSPDSPDETG